MVTRIGFLHDNGLKHGEIISETDPGDKYKVEVTQQNQVAEDTAELVVTDFDTNVDLDATNGLDVQTISSGPLHDKHDNYRSNRIVDDFSDGVARVAIKDYAESPAVWKSRNEYWSPDAFDFIPQNPTRNDLDIRTGHSDGEVLYHAITVMGPFSPYPRHVAVAVRNESTRTWGSYVQASDSELVQYDASESIELAPTFLTVPGLGTLLFYFALEGDTIAGFNEQLVKIFITKDHGVTWEKYGSIVLKPFFGNVQRTDYGPFAKIGHCALKATYYNNKIVLGMMLKGTGTAGTPAAWKINCQRIINLMVSNDLGKSWAVVPQEFISSSFYEDIQTGTTKFYGETYTSNVEEIALSFGLGYDIQGDKFVLVIRSGGEKLLYKDPDTMERFKKYGRLFFYYNVDDELFEWNSTDVQMKSHHLLDSFSKSVEDYKNYDAKNVNYEVLEYASHAGPDSLWYADGSVLRQSSPINGPDAGGGGYTAGEVYGGTQLIYKELTDPTTNRTVGIKVRMNVGGHFDDTAAITLFEDAGGGDIRATSNGHRLENGDKIIITGSPNYNGTYYIYSVTENTFEFFPGTGWLGDDSPATWTIDSYGDFGFGFCRQNSTDYYAIGITATNAVNGVCQLNFKRVDYNITVGSTITEAFMNKTSGGVANSWQKIDVGYNTWFEISVLFSGRQLMSVFFNDTYLFSVEDNYYRTGDLFFFTNNHDTAEFDYIGLLTSNMWFNIPATNLEGSPSSTYPQLGSNIDIATDMFGQSWICSETSGVGIEFSNSTTLDRFKRSGITLQKFKLGREIERVEGKFLAKEKYVVIFGDNEEYIPEAGYYFSITDYGILPTHTVGSQAMKRTYLSKFVWHRDDPVFMVQTMDDASLEETAIFERRGYSDLSLNANLGAYWHGIVYGVDPGYCGWEKSPSFSSTTGADDYIMQITEDDFGYFMQEYNLTSFGFSTNGTNSMPVKYFDYENRGGTFYFVQRSPSGNDASSVRSVCEFYMPAMDENPGVAPAGKYLRYRVRVNEGTGGATGSIALEEYISGTGWAVAGTYSNIDPTIWREFLLVVVPTVLASNTNNKPEISLYFKEETQEYWTAVVEGYEPTATTNTGVSLAQVKFGCFGSSGSTQNRTEWKIAAYSDTCFVDPTINRVRGETVQSGEDIHLTSGISIALSGGNTFIGDEWKIVDVSRRAFPKENVMERPAVVWQSADDSADKSIVIDAQHRMPFDTIVLTGVNCRDILFEANNTDSWGSPSVSVQLDMTKQNHIEYEKYSGRDHIVKVFMNSKKDEYMGDRFVCEDAALGSYRILSNMDLYLVYETDTTAVIPVSSLTRYLDIISNKIAFRLTTPQVYRYFRITCQTSSLSYPTPEGAFQIGQIFIGMFDQLQANPEYDLLSTRQRNMDSDRNASGVLKTKRRGRASRKRDFNFVAIDMDNRGFSDQLKNLHEHVRGRRIVYVEDIEEFTHAQGTYTFNVMPCFMAGVMDLPYQKGKLTTVKVTLEEDI